MAAKAKKTAKPSAATDVPFDLEMFRATPELAAIQKKEPGPVVAKPKQTPRQQTGFVMMTHAAARAGYLALDCPQALVWHYLHHLVWSTKSRTVQLSNKTLASWGVSRWMQISQLAEARTGRAGHGRAAAAQEPARHPARTTLGLNSRCQTFVALTPHVRAQRAQYVFV